MGPLYSVFSPLRTAPRARSDITFGVVSATVLQFQSCGINIVLHSQACVKLANASLKCKVHDNNNNNNNNSETYVNVQALHLLLYLLS